MTLDSPRAYRQGAPAISTAPRKRFVIADQPGHVQHTGSMLTGASTAKLSAMLVDARQCILGQSRW